MFVFSGSKKNFAPMCIVKALKSVREELNITPTADESITSHTLTTNHSGLFSVNETITTAKLADYLVRNDVVYLNLLWMSLNGCFNYWKESPETILINLCGFHDNMMAQTHINQCARDKTKLHRYSKI